MSKLNNTEKEILLGEAVSLTDMNLDQAISTIDSRFGEGTAKKNPSLISAVMLTTASHFHSLIQAYVEFMVSGEDPFEQDETK